MRIHGARSPRRASAPPRSSTASALSRGPDLPSRSCPLRAPEMPQFALADASADPGSRPVPRGSANIFGWPADAPSAGARSRIRGSTRPPTRTIRRTRAPARTHDTAQIDLPRARLLDGGAGRARRSRRMLPRGGRALDAFTTKARGIRPGPSLSPLRRSTSSPPLPPVTMSRDQFKGSSSKSGGSERSLTVPRARRILSASLTAGTRQLHLRGNLPSSQDAGRPTRGWCPTVGCAARPQPVRLA